MGALAITGHVEQPSLLTFVQLCALQPQVENAAELAPGMNASGLRLEVLFSLARLKPQASQVVLISRDGAFSARMALQAARECLLLYRLGSAPLPPALDGPMRLMVGEPGLCRTGKGEPCSSVRFLGGIEVLPAH